MQTREEVEWYTDCAPLGTYMHNPQTSLVALDGARPPTHCALRVLYHSGFAVHGDLGTGSGVD